jgi:hypothetical protein
LSCFTQNGVTRTKATVGNFFFGGSSVVLSISVEIGSKEFPTRTANEGFGKVVNPSSARGVESMPAEEVLQTCPRFRLFLFLLEFANSSNTLGICQHPQWLTMPCRRSGALRRLPT